MQCSKYSEFGKSAFDQYQSATISSLTGKPWKFINLLPFCITLFKRTAQYELEEIVAVEAQASVEVSKDKKGYALQCGDIIHFLYPQFICPSQTGSYFEIIAPEPLRGDSKIVKIGDVVYKSIEPSFFLNSHAEISGVNIHNHLAMPIEVWYGGNKVAYVHGDDKKGYLGGSKSITYVDNNGRGFRLGDELTFRIPFLRDKLCEDDHYVDVLLVDNFITDIHVGKVTTHHVPPPPDTFGYSASTSTHTGITYYIPQGTNAYESRKSNPYAVL